MFEAAEGEDHTAHSFTLHPLVEDIPLSSEEDTGNVTITCVELSGS